VPYSETIFGAGEIKAISGPFTYGVGQDFNRSFCMNNRQSLPELVSYAVYSLVRTPDENWLRQVPYERFEELLNDENYGDYVRTHFLQLPTGLNPAITKLTMDITKREDTPYGKLKAIQGFLETRYKYSLYLSRPLTNDPLYDFLFVNRSGHCEYFATAMAVMARIVGVPSRVAKGFQKGEWNNNGGFFEVRQRDAHAWVEVYFPDYGWVEFDPSPRFAADQYIESKRSLIARMFSRESTRLQIAWRRHVIGYNETRRLHLFEEIRHALFHGLPGAFTDLLRALAGTVRSLTPPQWAVAAAIIAGGLALALAVKKRGFFAALSWRMRRTKTARRGTLFYERMLSLLEKRKIIKPPTATALEFLDFPSLRECPIFPEVEKLTSIYYRVRFGNRTLSDGETAEINTILRHIIESDF
ncbi:MAG: transglutaminase domain-containing protein, partial [Candidatus Lindowbacteria bacterium]|nr:transglutaminase domain-containing protein [Candidatus Lindowbacteria bacterium]